MKMPEGKYMATLKIGEKGQIVIPKPARDMFNFKPGDTVLLLADAERGIAVVSVENLHDFSDSVFGPQDK